MVPKDPVSPPLFTVYRGQRAQVMCAGVLTTAEKGWFVLHLAPGTPTAHVLHMLGLACGMDDGSR